MRTRALRRRYGRAKRVSAKKHHGDFLKFDRDVRHALVTKHGFTEGGAEAVARGLDAYRDEGLSAAAAAARIAHFEAAHSLIPSGGPVEHLEGCPLCESIDIAHGA